MPQTLHHRGKHHVVGAQAFRKRRAVRPQEGGVRREEGLSGTAINEDDLRTLGQRVEEDLRARGLAEVDSDDVGKAILAPLRELDEVAYLRFASVYQNFDGLEDFQRAIDDLRKEKHTEAEQH